MLTIGIDPDSNKHGVAIYKNGKLIKLHMMNNHQIVENILKPYPREELLFSIENVLANNFVYTRNNKGNKSKTSKIAMSIGRCQQAQHELMVWLDAFKINYELHKPQKGNWANNKAQFKLMTGWEELSNPDTRAAAYFGFLAIPRAV